MTAIPKKSLYAIAALFELARRSSKDEVVQASAIARQHMIPEQYLRAIMGVLIKRGFVKSISGKLGGYALAMEPRDISIADVIEAVSGSIKLVRTPLRSKRFHLFWKKRSEETRQVLDRTLADLVDEISQDGESDEGIGSTGKGASS